MPALFVKSLYKINVDTSDVIVIASVAYNRTRMLYMCPPMRDWIWVHHEICDVQIGCKSDTRKPRAPVQWVDSTFWRWKLNGLLRWVLNTAKKKNKVPFYLIQVTIVYVYNPSCSTISWWYVLWWKYFMVYCIRQQEDFTIELFYSVKNGIVRVCIGMAC